MPPFLKLLFALRNITSIIAAMMLVALSACSSTTAHSTSSLATSPNATATPLPATFPAFHDWRAAYLAPDQRFHAITLDGKTDVIGPAFPGFEGTSNGMVFSAGASPDGYYIAFINLTTLDVYDLHTGISPSAILHIGTKYLPTTISWSPDSKHVVLGNEQFTADSTHVVSVAPLTIQETPPVPGTSAPVSGPYVYPEGWLDTHTLLMYTNSVQTTNPFTTLGILEAMDSTTGATRVITTWPHGEQSNPLFAMSPDGQEVFYYRKPVKPLWL